MEGVIRKELLGNLQGTHPKSQHTLKIDRHKELVNRLLINCLKHPCNDRVVGYLITTRISHTKLEHNNFQIFKKPPQLDI